MKAPDNLGNIGRNAALQIAAAAHRINAKRVQVGAMVVVVSVSTAIDALERAGFLKLTGPDRCAQRCSCRRPRLHHLVRAEKRAIRADEHPRHRVSTAAEGANEHGAPLVPVGAKEARKLVHGQDALVEAVRRRRRRTAQSTSGRSSSQVTAPTRWRSTTGQSSAGNRRFPSR